MRTHRQRKWMLLAAMMLGTAFQLTACREELSLFSLRVGFTSFTLPINQFIRNFLLGLA